MIYSEKSVPLSSAEHSQLRSEFRKGTYLSLVILPILLGAATFFYIMGSDFLPFRIFAPIFAIMAIVIVGLNYYQQRKDLRASTKTIITGKIEDKNERHSTSTNNNSSSHYYYFMLSGHEIAVDALQYAQFHLQDSIIIEKLPFTGKILSMRLLDNSKVMDAGKLPESFAQLNYVHDAPSITKPDFSESSYPFDDEEELRLRKMRNRFIQRSFRWVSIPMWLYLAFRVLMMQSSLWQEILHSRFTLTQFIVILPMIIQAIRMPKKIQPYNQDLNSGMKMIRRTTITDKRHGVKNGTKFWCISFNNKEYDVSMEFYDAMEIGEDIQFHYAENSQVQFSIRSAKSNSIRIDF